MYSNDTTQIRQGFTSYIGAIINSLNLQPRAAKQQIVNILTEEIMNVSQDENGLIDIYAIKPFLFGIVKFLNQRISELEKLEEKYIIKDTIDDYKQVAEFFSDLIKKI